MAENVIKNNNTIIVGTISSGMEFSHEVYGEGFYVFYVDVPRLSDSCDRLQVTISERLIADQDMSIGRRIKIEGQFRSYNNYKTEGNKLILTVFVREFEFINDDAVENPNQVYLDGFICKNPVYRTTPFGREITDILLAVNRPYNKSDYIPCISWGRNARYSKTLKIGDRIAIWGRIQSRPYQKKSEDGTVIDKIAYEVSVSKMEVPKDEEDLLEENEEVENEVAASLENVENVENVESEKSLEDNIE